jgi:hypothetical protein
LKEIKQVLKRQRFYKNLKFQRLRSKHFKVTEISSKLEYEWNPNPGQYNENDVLNPSNISRVQIAMSSRLSSRLSSRKSSEVNIESPITTTRVNETISEDEEQEVLTNRFDDTITDNDRSHIATIREGMDEGEGEDGDHSRRGKIH